MLRVLKSDNAEIGLANLFAGGGTHQPPDIIHQGKSDQHKALSR